MIHFSNGSTNSLNALNTKPQGSHSFFGQVRALLIKRIRSSPRDYRTLFFALVVPLLFAACAVVVAKVIPMRPSWFSDHVDPLHLTSFPMPVAVQGGGEMFGGSPFVLVPGNVTMNSFLKQYH